MPVLAILDEKGLGIWRPELNTIETQYLWESLDIARRVDQSEILWSPNGQSLIIVREHLPRMSYEQMEAASPKEIEQYLESRMTDVAVLQTAPRREVLRTESLPRLTLIEWEDDVAYRTRQHLPGRFNDAYLRRLVHSQN
ncbi:hypothetical protein CCAX7_007170 [Capsulimonas corticalis]|uniref:Uncharacterized protein n=2 Tax=Capsulimonas corticalis TaxID=2219043 RepID=A0A402D1Q7_9BACT|nr:hypothetical protein CCAX7_007170 [Capsulimonas corticalis]